MGVLTAHRMVGGSRFKIPTLEKLSNHKASLEGKSNTYSRGLMGVLTSLYWTGERNAKQLDARALRRDDIYSSPASKRCREDAEIMNQFEVKRRKTEHKRESQKTFYTGKLRLIVEYACALVRFRLATVNMYPTTRTMLVFVQDSFAEACGRVLTGIHKGAW